MRIKVLKIAITIFASFIPHGNASAHNIKLPKPIVKKHKTQYQIYKNEISFYINENEKRIMKEINSEKKDKV